jgi:ATP-binding protein involved in chromosome partitioning
MSYFVCPHCGERTDIFSHGGARHEAERLGVPFLGEVPLDLQIRLTSDSGKPIVVADSQSPHAKVYREIAAAAWAEVKRERAEGKRAPPKIVVED